jgi:hypothetical protein
MELLQTVRRNVRFRLEVALAKTFPSSTLVELERTAHYAKHGFASNQAGTSNWLASPRRNRTTSERRAFNFACQEAQPNPIFLNLGGRTTGLEKCQTVYEHIDAGNGAADGVGNFWSNAPSGFNLLSTLDGIGRAGRRGVSRPSFSYFSSKCLSIPLSSESS